MQRPSYFQHQPSHPMPPYHIPSYHGPAYPQHVHNLSQTTALPHQQAMNHQSVTPQQPVLIPPQSPPTYQQPPPSPSQSDRDPIEDEAYQRTRFGPAPPSVMRCFDGFKYALEVVQEPTRARMCGFGDKDRRPISTPPVIKAVIYDAASGVEVDYKDCDIELSHLVCSVRIFDAYGKEEKDIVRTSPGQQIISASFSGAYPTRYVYPTQDRIAHRVTNEDAVYRQIHGRHEPNSSYGSQSAPNSGHHQPNQYTADHYQQGGYPGAPTYPYAGPPQPAQHTGRPSWSQAQSPYDLPTSSNSFVSSPISQISTGPRQPPTPPAARNEDQHTAHGYSRNLIGSNSTTGQLLEDTKGNFGIFFIFSDLSVRSEDFFRLQFKLFNFGMITSHMSEAQIFEAAAERHTAPTAPGDGHDRQGTKKLEGIKAGLVTRGTAPELAQVFSQVFKVYTAKKFPGVAESTELSKKFAEQGVKISIRRDGKRKRDDDDEDEDGAGQD